LTVEARRRNDETIRRIAVKRCREAVERDHDLDVQRKNLNHVGRRCISDPVT
jgi:hypothetical protein